MGIIKYIYTHFPKIPKMEFNNLGNRCVLKECNQQDYLAVRCGYCTKFHCTFHAGSHDCPDKMKNDRKLAKCSDCLETISYFGERTEAEVLKEHSLKGCTREALAKNLKKISQKKICTAKGCLKKLNDVNKYVCKSCGQWTCLRHRYVDMHPCGQKIEKRLETNMAVMAKEMMKMNMVSAY